ncbi:MAG: sulfite exporter TauE/SafE family protein [Gammaproteobacteria bacterium]|nr:sulfite exporter TauE/SafE family protein [Gammaproteobacteria bacterium]
MGNFDNELWWLCLPVVLLAGMVHGTFGLGFPMVATPLIALYTDVRSAVLLTLLPTIAVNISLLVKGNGSGEAVGRYWSLLPYVLIGTLIGTTLLLLTDPRPFLLVLAGAILLYLNQDRLRLLSFGWIRRWPRLANAVFGLTAGVMAGSVNVMVPILIVFALELKMATHAMIQLFNVNFLTGKLTQTMVFVTVSEVSLVGLIQATAWLVPVALGGLFGGQYLNKRISEQRYRWILRGLLWLMAGVLISRYIFLAHA